MLFEYYVQEYEHLLDVILPSCSIKAGRPIEQNFTILDLHGLGVSHFNSQTRQILKQLTAISQNYYPEILGKMMIINAPSVFTLMWNFVKPLIDEKTVAKISWFGTKDNWREKLLTMVDADQLPDFLGGRHMCGNDWVDTNFGPWADRDILKRVHDSRPFVPLNLYMVGLQNLTTAAHLIHSDCFHEGDSLEAAQDNTEVVSQANAEDNRLYASSCGACSYYSANQGILETPVTPLVDLPHQQTRGGLSRWRASRESAKSFALSSFGRNKHSSAGDLRPPQHSSSDEHHHC
eukprot:GHVS01000056.1.p1 GENE.GHVS01000056.1~~GHVS01000056.1.p1  ORF type:complete len:291 (+),score=33.17 GHVS01000056.1:290-1162(+)